MKGPTEKQLKLIRNMERMLDVKFSGHTIKDASRFISKHMEEYQEEQELLFDMVYYYDAF